MEEQEFTLVLERFRAIGRILTEIDPNAAFEEIERREYQNEEDLGIEKAMCRALIKAKRIYDQLPSDSAEKAVEPQDESPVESAEPTE